jgi:prevent-host-death family protein
MTTSYTVQQFRTQLADVLNNVSYAKSRTIITKYGKQMAVLVNPNEFAALSNPRSKFTKAKWEKGFSFLETLTNQAQPHSQKQINQDITQAIADVRAGKQKSPTG